jgi:sulfide dehydrogenase subunit beta
MAEILKKQRLAENIYSFKLRSPEIAAKAQPGNFVILRLNENGERIPLTISDYDKNSITIVVQVVGKTTNALSKLKKGEKILDLVGPLGNKSEIEKIGTVCLVAGGVGCAEIFPITKAFKKKGNKVIVIFGARNKKLLFLEKEFKEISDKFILCTDDGSKGKKGFVTEALRELMKKTKLDLVIAVGPIPMMKAVANLTKDIIKTKVSLNSIMVDGIGMCGCCRVTVDNEIKFVCVDGPEFNAHKVNFDELEKRNSMYKEEHVCKLGKI